MALQIYRAHYLVIKSSASKATRMPHAEIPGEKRADNELNKSKSGEKKYGFPEGPAGNAFDPQIDRFKKYKHQHDPSGFYGDRQPEIHRVCHLIHQTVHGSSLNEP